MSKVKPIKLAIESANTETTDALTYTTVLMRDERGSVIASAVLQTKHQDDNLHKRFTNAVKGIIKNDIPSFTP